MRLSGNWRFTPHKRASESQHSLEAPPMDQPIRRSQTAVRAYADQLHALMKRLGTDPLNEDHSVALVAHIVNNRSSAADLFYALEDQALGVPC